MRLVSGAKYADLFYRYERVTEAREEADKLAAERLCTIVRLCGEVDQLRDQKPDTPVQHPKPSAGEVELRRQLDLARRAVALLEAQCRGLQDSHEADTRELHDLRQGVSS